MTPKERQILEQWNASRAALNPRTGRPTSPTGFRSAWRRLWKALADLGHAWPDVHVEGVRELGVPDPAAKIVGKGIVAMEIGAVVALIAWPILVAL